MRRKQREEMRYGLRLVGGTAARLVRSPDSETDVLADAIRDMDNWISRLPASSDWRWAFLDQRGVLAGELAQRRREPDSARGRSVVRQG